MRIIVTKLFLTTPFSHAQKNVLIDTLSPNVRTKWDIQACPIQTICDKLSKSDLAQLNSQVQSFSDYSLVVLISSNAVKALASHLSIWPINVAVACTGESTYHNWRDGFVNTQAVKTQIVARENDSAEHLIEHIRNATKIVPNLLKRVLIVRAQTGRNFLQASLEKMGVKVELCCAYYRKLNQIALRDAQQWVMQSQTSSDTPAPALSYWYFSSSETLRLWYEHLVSQYLLNSSKPVSNIESNMRLLVSHQRIWDNAYVLGWRQMQLVNNLSAWLTDLAE